MHSQLTTLQFFIVKIKHSCRFRCLESTSSIKTFFLSPALPSWCLSVFVFLGRLTEAHRTAVKVIRRMQYFVARRKFQVSSRINHKCISWARMTTKGYSEWTCLGEHGCKKSQGIFDVLGLSPFVDFLMVWVKWSVIHGCSMLQTPDFVKSALLFFTSPSLLCLISGFCLFNYTDQYLPIH